MVIRRPSLTVVRGGLGNFMCVLHQKSVRDFSSHFSSKHPWPIISWVAPITFMYANRSHAKNSWSSNRVRYFKLLCGYFKQLLV